MLKTVNFYPRLMVLWTISCPNSSQNEKSWEEEEEKQQQGKEDKMAAKVYFFYPILK